jgi:hypothetical protein
MPKARDLGAATADERIRYASLILPKWVRRTKSLDVLLPALYLRGVVRIQFGALFHSRCKLES